MIFSFLCISLWWFVWGFTIRMSSICGKLVLFHHWIVVLNCRYFSCERGILGHFIKRDKLKWCDYSKIALKKLEKALNLYHIVVTLFSSLWHHLNLNCLKLWNKKFIIKIKFSSKFSSNLKKSTKLRNRMKKGFKKINTVLTK